MSSDAKDMVNPDIEGPSEAMRCALEDAELAPSDIEYLNAHGTATTINDANETHAIKAVFGNHAKKLADLVDQVDARASARRRRRHRGGGLHQGHRARAGCRRPSGSTSPIRECDLDYVPTSGRDQKVTLRDVELVRLRRPQRGARVRPAARLSQNLPRPRA